MRKLFSVFLVLYLLVLGVAHAEPQGEVVVAFGALSKTLDPQLHYVRTAFSICRHIFDPLVMRDENMKIVPVLMTRWERLDPLSLKIWLRKGITFHNGEPFDARAVKFTLERYIDPNMQSGQKFFLRELDRVEIIDDYTAIIRTKAPKAPLLPYLCMIDIAPPKAASHVDQFGVNPIGTGPYKFVKFIPNDRVVVVANEDYWGKPPTFKKITFRMLKEDATRVSALLAHEVHVIKNLPPGDIPRVKADPELEVIATKGNRFAFIAFNCFKKDLPFFKDKRIRQALNYAVDREEIITFLLSGLGSPAVSPLAPCVDHFQPQTPAYTYDLEKAKELMKAAEYPDGLPGTYTLLTPWGRYLKDREIAEAISGMWARIGVNVKVLPLEWATYIAERRKKGKSKGDITLGAFGAPTMEPDLEMKRMFRSPNWLGYKNDQLDKIIDKGSFTYDFDEQKKIYANAQAIIWDECPVVFIYYQPDIIGKQKRLKGLKPRVDESIHLHNAYFE